MLCHTSADVDGCGSSLDEDSEAIVENYCVLLNGRCYTLRLHTRGCNTLVFVTRSEKRDR